MTRLFDSNLETIAIEAEERRDDYAAFRYFVELDERSDAELDAMVEAIAGPIQVTIDCTQCANCCRKLDVYLTEADAQRVADGANVSFEQLIKEKIDCQRAAAVGEWGVLAQQPCSFLEGKLCRVYSHRPESCRTYPVFTPDFRWTLEDILGGVGLCPIIYHVIEQLQIELGWK